MQLYFVPLIIKRNGYTSKRDNFVKIVMAPFWKGLTLKEKNLLALIHHENMPIQFLPP